MSEKCRKQGCGRSVSGSRHPFNLAAQHAGDGVGTRSAFTKTNREFTRTARLTELLNAVRLVKRGPPRPRRRRR